MPTGMEMQINTGKMRSAAKVVDNQMSIIRGCFDSIRKEGEALRDNHWEGASSDAFCDSMRLLCSEQASSGSITAGYVVKTLQEYVERFNLAADSYDKTEINLDSKLDALPIDIFGI